MRTSEVIVKVTSDKDIGTIKNFIILHNTFPKPYKITLSYPINLCYKDHFFARPQTFTIIIFSSWLIYTVMKSWKIPEA